MMKHHVLGASADADQALVTSDQAASRLAPTGFDPSRVAELRERLRPIAQGGDDACLKGSPMIPLHRDTVAEIFYLIDDLYLSSLNKAPAAICGYPLPGWRLDQVKWDERSGQPDGWIVSLKVENPDWRMRRREVCVMARSDLGPLEAWDEAIRIAQRSDARAIAMEAGNGRDAQQLDGEAATARASERGIAQKEQQ